MSTQGKKKSTAAGRPRIRLEKLATIPTRCPISMHNYFKMIYPFRYKSLTELYEVMLERFIALEAWDHGVTWRNPRVQISRTVAGNTETGWQVVNVSVSEELKIRVVNISKLHKVSAASFVYTAMFWWVMYVMPPSQPAMFDGLDSE